MIVESMRAFTHVYMRNLRYLPNVLLDVDHH